MSKSYVGEVKGELWLYDANNTYTVYNVENDTLIQGRGSASILSTMQKTFIKPESGGTESIIAKDSDGVVSLGTGTDLVQVTGGCNGGGIADTSGNNIVFRESATGVITLGSGKDVVLVTGGGTGGGIADTSGNNIVSRESATGVITLGSGKDVVKVTGGGTGGGIAVSSGDNIIKKKTDGSVHIGTNSFITREFGGK